MAALYSASPLLSPLGDKKLRFHDRITHLRRIQPRPAAHSSARESVSAGVLVKSREADLVPHTGASPSHLVGQFYKLSPLDQVFVVLGLLSCLSIGALFAALVTAIPALKAIYRAAISVEKLSAMAREELPGTMAAIRLSSMEISDLTLELNDLSQEITEGVRSSTRAVQAAEFGIRRMGAVAASQAFAVLQERATVPVEAVKPVVANAAQTTRQAVLQAQKAVLMLAATHPQISRWLAKRTGESPKQS